LADIVLAVPLGAASFQRAREALTHYHVMVEDDEVDQAQAALKMVGTFVPEEVRP
jgi:ribosomal protein L35AE/L33A